VAKIFESSSKIEVKNMKFVLIILMVLPQILWAAPTMMTEYHHLSGTVTDAEGNPLAGANILVPALNTGTSTNNSGEYRFNRLPAGRYQIVIRYMGYLTQKIDINLIADLETVAIRLDKTILSMPAINVTASSAPTDILTSSRTVSVLSKTELESQCANSLSGALRTLPGVQIVDQGPMIAKPMIRGMTNQRIVILKDGVKHEAQQWSNHHTPETDLFEAEKIEVLRGPASLLYGSGAIGGVIQILTQDPQTLGDGAPAFGMNLTTQLFTNTEQGAASLSLFGAGHAFGWRVHLSGRESQYYAVPGQQHFLVKQLDTGFAQWNARGIIGFQSGNLNLKLDANHYWEEQTLIGEGHWHNSGGPNGGPWYHAAGAIKSPTLHQKAQLSSVYRLGLHRLEFDFSLQHDHRQGIPNGMTPQVDLAAWYAESNLKFQHIFDVRFPGIIGLAVDRKIDETLGVEVLIPNSNGNSLGFYFMQNYHGLKNIQLSAGLRTDWRQINFKETVMQKAYLDDNRQIIPGYVVPEGQKNFHGIFSGSLGIVWRQPDRPFSLAANFGSGWRAPTPVELYIRGVHHASYEYMLGDSEIQPEQSMNTDVIFRWVNEDVVYEFSTFYNRIYDYIFANPTGEFFYLGYLENIPIYRFEQSDARLYGFEWHNQFRLTRRVRFDFGYDLVRGEVLSPVIDADGDGRVEKNLPQISPDRFHGAVTLHLGDGFFLKNIKLNCEAEHYFLQDQLGEFENVLNRDADGNGRNDELISEGYSLLHATASGETSLFGMKTGVTAAVRNLLNEKYFSHLSNYKGIARNPGFDFSLMLKFQL
jgi:iron complex outermembrane receptor protein